ncbi:MAG: polysaccharide deacetylase family protein [Candidatus Binatia bacterium]
MVKTGIASALDWSGTDRMMEGPDLLMRRPVVLCYHRTVEDFAASTADSLPAMLTSRAMLERHLDCLGRRFEFVSLDDLGAWLEGRKEFTRSVAAVTFDDGYADFYDHAFPLLQRKGIPAAMFVPTDFVGTSALQMHDHLFLLLARAFERWDYDAAVAYVRSHLDRGQTAAYVRKIGFDQWTPPNAVSALLGSLPRSAVSRLIEELEDEIELDPEALETHRALTWEMIAEMHRSGVTIGSHTKTHVELINESRQTIIDEIDGSRKELEHRLGAPVAHIAYPDGQFNPAVVEAADLSGYRFGYTTCRHRHRRHPLLTIPRVILWENSCIDARGNFSPAIFNCLARGVFPFTYQCLRDHHRTAGNGIDV